MLKTLGVKCLCVMKRNKDFWIVRQNLPQMSIQHFLLYNVHYIVLTLERNIFKALIFRKVIIFVYVN